MYLISVKLINTSIFIYLFILDWSFALSLKTLLCYKLHILVMCDLTLDRFFRPAERIQIVQLCCQCFWRLKKKKKKCVIHRTGADAEFTLIAAATETDAQLAEVITHVKLFTCVLKQELCLKANEPHNEKLYKDCHYWMLFMWH